MAFEYEFGNEASKPQNPDLKKLRVFSKKDFRKKIKNKLQKKKFCLKKYRFAKSFVHKKQARSWSKQTAFKTTHPCHSHGPVVVNTCFIYIVLVKGVFSPVPPYCGYFVPSHLSLPCC